MDTDAAARDGIDEEQLEGGPWRRAGISLFVVFTLVAILSSLMPGSELRDGLRSVTGPYLNATGLDQTWDMFGPNPQIISTFVVARVEHADGTTAEYRVPHGRGIAAYWDYRWLKYADLLSLSKETRAERASFARWVVEQDRDTGGVPARVTLVRFTSELTPPGPEPAGGPWGETVIYSSEVGAP